MVAVDASHTAEILGMQLAVENKGSAFYHPLPKNSNGLFRQHLQFDERIL